MLVYGDHAERIDPRRRLAEIAERTQRSLAHDELTDLFVDAAGLVQGIADADFAQSGVDRERPTEALLLAWLTRLGGVLLQSWDAGQSGGSAERPPTLDDLPGEVSIKLAEGYAFYAVRPEAFALAARRLVLNGTPRVIGLRSIGVGLACMAAAALKVDSPFTLRPSGEPFDRQPRIDDDLARALLAGDPHFVIVDEGPGLSGSSFGGMADWLEQHAVSPDRIAFLPSHHGDLGAQAKPRHRERWATAQRPVVMLDEPRREWIEALVGTTTGWKDVSGGQWRPLWSAAEEDWPAIDPLWERRKFIAKTADGEFLVKWAGLGRSARAKLALTRHLERWVPETIGMAHGWLVTRWHAEAVPTRPTVNELIAYLRARAALPAPAAGASLETLVAMVRRNASSAWAPNIGALAVRPVLTDNRLAAHEWLRLPGGRLLKADPLDHHQTHDLVGCQDIAWDVAGLVVELNLSPAATKELCDALGVSPELLGFYEIAYHAFRLGAHRMSAASLNHWPDEQRRNEVTAKRHADFLARVDSIQYSGDIA